MTSSTQKKLKAVVVGTGWGSVHARGFAKCPGAELVAVWSRTDKPEARAVAKEMGVPLYTDYHKMFAEKKPDIVGVATQEAGHEAPTIAALNAGAHVYCEKVLSDSPAAAQRMIDTAQNKGRQLGVGYNYRYSPSCLYLTQVVKSGGLGQILFAQLRAFTWCVHHMTDYTLGLLGSPTRVSGFFDDKPLPTRPHISVAGHKFATFSYAAFTKKVYTVECQGGAILMAAATDYVTVEEPGAALMVQGSHGRAELDDLTGSVTISRGGRESSLWRPSQIRDSIGLENNGVAAATDFARAMAAGEPAPIPGQAGLDMILLEEAIMRSALHGNRWETIQEDVSGLGATGSLPASAFDA